MLNNKLYWINDCNGSNYGELFACAMLRKKFKNEKLYAAILGSAYGGSGEGIGNLWKDYNGEVHLFDTFEGHPEYLADDPNSWSARCMDRWKKNLYAGQDRIPYLTEEMLTYEYQRKALDEEGLNNVILHKGLINDNSLDGIDKLHYAFLDMDLPASMALGYEIVKNKLVKGGYLGIHDANPKNHIEGLWELYEKIMATGEYKEIIHCDTAYLIVLEKL